MVNGNVPLLRPLRLFRLIAGLMANWYASIVRIFSQLAW
jgi:hypothetical protein